MSSQQFGDLDLRQAVLADQRVHDPGFLDLARPASGAVQSVNRRLRAAFIGLDPTRHEPLHRFQFPRGSQSFESVNKFPTAFDQADDNRRDLAIAL
jgi:hypothetical protein